MSQPSLSRSFTKTYRKAPYPSISPTLPAHSATGKTVLITAGHTGIGYAIATNFAVAGAAHIIIVGRRADVLEKASHDLAAAHPATKFHVFAVSITDEDKVRTMFEEIRRDIPEPDILVTSAAYFAVGATMAETSMQQMSASFDTNVTGNFTVVQAFLGHAASHGSGEAAPRTLKREKIILDVSTAVTHCFFAGTGAYSASKLAFTRLMAYLHTESSTSPPSPLYDALRVHSFHPGTVLSPAARGSGYDENTLPWDDVQLPGQFAVWLASPEAEFLKGRFVWANWDVDELVSRKAEIEAEDLLQIGLIGKAEWDIAT